MSAAPEQARLIREARQVNDGKPVWVLEKVKTAVSDYLLEHPWQTAEEISIVCLGLAFKPDIDDLRESPALEIALKFFQIFPGQIVAVEPNVTCLPNGLHERLTLKSLEGALSEAHIAVLLVAHKEFQGILKKLRPDQVLLNFCSPGAPSKMIGYEHIPRGL